MLAHCRRDQRGLVSAALREVFNAEDRDQARDRLGHVLDRLGPVCPRVCGLLEDAEEDLIAFYAFPREHPTKLRSTNPQERVNKEIGRRSDVVGIFPNDASVIRLAGALLSEQNDEWLVQRRYLSAESISSAWCPSARSHSSSGASRLASASATRPLSGSALPRRIGPSLLLGTARLVLSAVCSRPRRRVGHPRAGRGRCEPFALGGGYGPVDHAVCHLPESVTQRAHVAGGWPA